MATPGEHEASQRVCDMGFDAAQVAHVQALKRGATGRGYTDVSELMDAMLSYEHVTPSPAPIPAAAPPPRQPARPEPVPSAAQAAQQRSSALLQEANGVLTRAAEVDSGGDMRSAVPLYARGVELMAQAAEASPSAATIRAHMRQYNERLGTLRAALGDQRAQDPEEAGGADMAAVPKPFDPWKSEDNLPLHFEEVTYEGPELPEGELGRIAELHANVMRTFKTRKCRNPAHESAKCVLCSRPPAAHAPCRCSARHLQSPTRPG